MLVTALAWQAPPEAKPNRKLVRKRGCSASQFRVGCLSVLATMRLDEWSSCENIQNPAYRSSAKKLGNGNMVKTLMIPLALLSLAVAQCTQEETVAENSEANSAEVQSIPVYQGGVKEGVYSHGVEISFDGDGYSGTAGCNNFFGDMETLADGRVKFGIAAMTRKMCIDNEVMERENHFAKNFPGTYKMTKTDDAVILESDQVSWYFKKAQ